MEAKHSIYFILLFTLLTACTENKQNLNIAVASNFEPTLKKIIQKYPNNKQTINIIAGSSGLLTNQILNNAPFDLFLSADTVKPDLIYKKLNLKIPPKVYAMGKLALWIPDSSGNNCIQKLASTETLAIPNPKTAPYGKAAQNILDKFTVNAKKVIQTANASQAYIYTKDKLTKAGFIPYSMSKNESKGCLQVFNHVKLSQSMLLLNDKASPFYKFIQSPKVKKTIKEAGYW